jgi:hypothetical protein
MKVSTANIVVAYTKETMDRLFSAGATYKSLVAELSDGDTDALLFNNVANPNFISFEHSLGLGGGMKMVLTFIDPKGEFESRFFKTNPAKLIQGYSNPEAEKTTSFITDKPDDVKQSQSEYSKEFVAQYKKELQDSIGEKEIYIAYGTGSNLDLWSGPHRTILTNADISLKGNRKITLTLTPTANPFDIGQRRGSYNEVVNLNLQGLKIRYSGLSQTVDFLEDISYDPFKYLDLQERAQQDIQMYQQEVITTLGETGFKDVVSKVEKYDFHNMVVDAIRNYVQKATSNKNVIVLLPNINFICRQAISDEARKVEITDITNQAAVVGATAVAGLLGGVKFSRSLDLHSARMTDLGKEHLFVEGFLKSLGLRMHEGEKESISKLERESKTSEKLGTQTANEQNKSAEEAVEKFFKDRFFTAVIDKTERKVPDHKAVIQGIFDNIKQLAQESYPMSTLAVMTETDLNVLKLWAKNPYKKYYSFAGYDDFTENSPAIIVGDLALIKEYLYGGVDIDQKFKSIDKLKNLSNAYSKKSKQNLNFKSFNSITNAVAALGEVAANVQASKDAATAAINQIPLHPLDRTILAKKDYNKKIRTIVNPVVKGVGAFGDISYIPDDFGYQDSAFSDEEKKYIEENGIPTFRYNTQNPNILDLKFKFGGVYFSTLKLGYQKEISRLSSGIAEGILPTGIGSFPIRSRGAAIAYLRNKGFSMGLGDDNKKAILKGLASRLSPELAEELEVDSAEAGADSFAAIIEELEQKNLHGLVLVDQELPGNPNSILADQAEDLYRKALQMSITTLPTFHISKTSSVNTPCIVFAQDQPISQVIREKRTLMNRFFSGLYKIMGFKHSITSSAVTSEFSLVKNAPNYNLKQDD